MRLAPPLALRLALRDLRGGVRGMGIVLACLALGVAAIAAVGSLNASVNRGLQLQGRVLLGGDLSIDGGAQELPDRLHAWLAARGAKISAIVTMRSLLVAPSGDRQLIDLKSVDGAYPLAGSVRLEPAMDLAHALDGGVLADPLVLQRLHLKPGDRVRIGDASLVLRAALAAQPDPPAGVELLGPPVIIGAASLAATGLIQPGSLLKYEWRVVLPAAADPGQVATALRQDFPATGWRIRTAREPAPGLERAIEQTTLFLTLVGLSSLLVGGIGVATGVRAWLDSRARTIAILRCLGGEEHVIFSMILAQVLALCGIGIAIGVLAGAALPAACIAAFGNSLPVPAALGVYPAPLARAALYGMLTAAAFSLWPLGRAARIPGAALFRDSMLPASVRPRRLVMGATWVTGACLILLVVAGAADPGFALSFCLGALAMLAIFRAGAWLLMRAAHRIGALRPAWLRLVWLRLGFANLYRPGSATPLLVVALGLGLTTLTSVALIEGNIRQSLVGDLPRDAPSFFFIDIQNDELAQFLRIVNAQPGVGEVHEMPSMRARIVALNGVPVENTHVAPDSEWALRGDRAVTYAASLPRGSTLVAGAWWPARYAGAPLLSLDADLARGWGLRIGDTLTANVLGRDIVFRIANTRHVNWRGMAINFTMVASPGLLEHAPHMHIATVRTPPSGDAALLRAVTDALPNVTGIRIADVIATVTGIIAKLAAALAGAGAITLGSGALVLAGAVAAGQRRRRQDAVILKTLGATLAQIRAAWLIEFGLIGCTAGSIAALLGSVASWAMMRFVLHAPWRLLPMTVCAIVLGCVCLMMGFGWVGTAAVLRARPAAYLRER